MVSHTLIVIQLLCSGCGPIQLTGLGPISALNKARLFSCISLYPTLCVSVCREFPPTVFFSQFSISLEDLYQGHIYTAAFCLFLTFSSLIPHSLVFVLSLPFPHHLFHFMQQCRHMSVPPSPTIVLQECKITRCTTSHFSISSITLIWPLKSPKAIQWDSLQQQLCRFFCGLLKWISFIELELQHDLEVSCGYFHHH